MNNSIYNMMKDAAIARHKLWNILFENGTGNIDNTWHQAIIRIVYPR